MAQYEIQLKDLIRIARKRRNIIIFSAVALSALSFIFTKMQSPTPIYLSTADVKYDKRQSQLGLFPGAFYWSPYDNINSQTKVITSFPVLEKAAKKLGMLEEDLSSEEILNSKENMNKITAIEGMVDTEVEENTNIININVISIDPEYAARVANALAESYYQFNKEDVNRRIIDTKSFIEVRLKEVEDRLKEAEDNLKKFQNEREIVSLDMQAIMDLEYLYQLENDYEALKRENATLEFFDEELSSGSISSKDLLMLQNIEIHSTLYRLNAELQGLLLEKKGYLATYTTNHPRIKELTRKITEVNSLLISEVKSRLNTNDEMMKIIEDTIADYKKRTAEYPDDNLTLARLKREVELQSELYAELNTKYQEVLIEESGMEEEVTIVKPALTPEVPINPPKTTSTVIIGIVLGLILGVFFAVIMENLDTSIGTIEDVESYLEIPVLGVIPYIPSIKEVDKSKDEGAQEEREKDRGYPLVLYMSPKSQIMEAYRSLRTNILFLNQERDVKTIMVTSSSLQEGKTINCINSAITLALGGYKTLLVETDLRRGTIGKVFSIERSPGVTDVILGSAPWKDVIRDINDIMLGGFDIDDLIKSPELSNLHIITSGAFPTNPSEIINSRQMSKFIEDVKEEYDFVILDSPPVLPVTDAVLLSQKVDGVIILYEVGRIARGVLKRAKSHLEGVKADILGIILNGVRPEYGPDYFEYHYQYYYGEVEKPGRPSDLERIKGIFKRESLSHLVATTKEGLSNIFKKEKK